VRKFTLLELRLMCRLKYLESELIYYRVRDSFCEVFHVSVPDRPFGLRIPAKFVRQYKGFDRAKEC